MVPPLQLRVGSRVKCAPKHWLYPNASGTIVEIDWRCRNPFLVKFDVPHGGLDEDSIWLDEVQLTVIHDV